MDGQKVFEALSSMTEDERKRCSFWWLVGSQLLNNDVEYIMSDLLYNRPQLDVGRITKEYLDTVPTPVIVEVLNSCETSMSDEAIDSYWDEYQGRYYSWFETDIEKFLKSKGYLQDEDE